MTRTAEQTAGLGTTVRLERQPLVAVGGVRAACGAGAPCAGTGGAGGRLVTRQQLGAERPGRLREQSGDAYAFGNRRHSKMEAIVRGGTHHEVRVLGIVDVVGSTVVVSGWCASARRP